MRVLKPSDFSGKFPHGSVQEKRESEVVALNTMNIMKRTGDTFRVLSLEEYGEEYYFDKVREYCVSAEQASKFSPVWNKIFVGNV